MDAKLVSILADLQAVAERRQWPEVTSAIATLLSREASPVILLAPARGVNVAPIQHWIEEATGNQVEVQGLEELAYNCRPALLAAKVIAVFECGRLLEADAVDAVAEALFSRPLSSYAITLSNAERITDEEDLHLVERGAWRLLVPDPKPDWAGQELLEHQCYLFGTPEVEDFLQSRVERDKEALTTWLLTPLESPQELARHQALSVIDLAEEYVEKNRAVKPRRAPSKAERLLETREALVQLRRRLVRRLDADAASSRRQLTASLQTLELDLLQDLRPYLEQRSSRSVSITEARLRKILTRYITERASSWKHQTEALMLSRSEEIRMDTEELLRSLDWSLINDVVLSQGKTAGYPEALLQEWTTNAGISVIAGMKDSGGTTRKSALSLPDVLQATVAAATMAATSTLFGLLPAGLIAIVLGALMVNHHREQSLGDSETYGRVVIRTMIRTAISSLQGGTPPAVANLRRKIFDELKALEALLDHALDEACQPAQEVKADPDGVLLDSYRREILTVG